MADPPFGILNVYKAKYVTSRAAVNVVERAVKPAKAGHAGTLDPMATGVLLVCIGKATRLVSRIQQLPKIYRSTFVFGQVSPTDDATGTVTATGAAVPDESAVRQLLPDFTGDIEQTPPRFSAVHIDGKRAYKLARRGEEVKLQPKAVHIARFDLLEVRGAEFEFEIECGSGTYIRSLARDLGERLGCGGLMSALERTRIGPFAASDSIEVGGGATPLRPLSEADVRDKLRSPLIALPGVPQHTCDAEQTHRVRLGRPIDVEEVGAGDGDETALLDPDGKLIALAERRGTSFKPTLVFHAIQ